MRILIILFSVYLCALTFVPCPEASACTDSCDEELHLYDIIGDQQGGEAEHECSPFCFCSCCQVYKVTAESTVRALLLPFTQNQTPLILHFYSKKVTSVWHPPQG